MLKFFAVFFRLCFITVLASMTQTSFASDIKKGAEIYYSYCADCHGATGTSVMQDTPNFAQFEGLVKSDVLLLEAISKGNNAMPAYYGILSDQEILDVIDFLRTLN